MADSVKVTFAKLNGSNYVSWKYRMMTMLEREEVWHVIVDPKPEEVDEAFRQWQKDDRKARTTIALFVEDNQLRFVKKATSAREMWHNLKTYHEKATIGNQALLLQQLCALNLSEGGDVERHIEETENLYERLDNAGVELSELLRIIMMLRSLPPSFNSFVTSLENRPQEDLTMDLVVARLRDECQKRASQPGASGNNEKALKTEVKPRSDKRKCFFCNMPGHLRKNCRKFLATKRNDNVNQAAPKSSEQQAKQAQAEPEPKPRPSTSSSTVQGAVCFIAGGAIPGAWTIDSGCTCHMTNDRQFFNEFQRDVVVEVTLADGTTTKSAGCGNGVLFGVTGDGKRIAIRLESVLYVPTLEGGLISVRKLALKGFAVVFQVDRCEIRAADGAVIAVGETVGNQYKLKTAEQCKAVMADNHSDRCQHTWHRRLGHRDASVLKLIKSKDLANGLDVKDCGQQLVCECCLQGKLARSPFPPVVERSSKQPLDLVHSDLCGPMEHSTPSGNKYLMTVIDDYSRFCVVYLLKSKAEAADKIREYVRWTENVFGRKPRAIRTDGGGEYTGHELLNFYKAEGIETQFTVPYSPQQNGVAERKNRSLQEMANCMLLDANLPKRYWGEAVLTAAYTQNRLPSRVVERTPYEMWTGSKPDLTRFRVFGCAAYVHIPDSKRKKFDPKAQKLVFVGYSDHHKGFRFLDRATDRIVISRDARFMELASGSEQQEPDDLQERVAGQEETSDGDCEVTVNGGEYEAEVIQEEAGSERSVYEDADNTDESDFFGFEDENELEAEEENPEGEVCLRRSDRQTRGVLPKHFENYVVGLVQHCEEPDDFRQALAMPEWNTAMKDELKAHELNGTWELASLPIGKKVIGAKWVFKLKRDETGKVIKHKARIVAQGYTQRFGVDFTDVFAPVTRQTTLRAFLAIAGKQKLILRQYDVKTAYLNGSLDEELYMRQPPGFEASGQEELVCRLKKSIYGLRQSARCWNKALDSVLRDLRFQQCESDPCLYVRRSGSTTVYLLVYVDDLIIGCTDKDEIHRVYKALRDKFDITDLGPVRFFLGFEIERESGYYSLKLTSNIEQLAAKFGMQNAAPVKTPMNPGYVTANCDSKKFPDVSRYRSLVGALLYLAVNARPDVSISVGLLGRKVSDPNQSDWAAAKRVLQYLNTTKHHKLNFGPGQDWKLVGYSDSDWAGDQRTRKSTSGIVFFFGGGPISWISKSQATVALSSLEAEYNALTVACQEAIWIRRLLQELGEPQSEATTLFEDNQGCICFAKAERSSGRVKHIETKGHFIRELCERKTVVLTYCPTTEMVADALTKPLGPSLHIRFVERIGLVS